MPGTDISVGHCRHISRALPTYSLGINHNIHRVLTVIEYLQFVCRSSVECLQLATSAISAEVFFI